MADDLDKVKKIIEQSGNSFHCKVLQYLQDNGWTVLISPYYNDNVSSKPREIDLIAEKAFNTKNGWGEFNGNINVKLFIECKYIPQKTVFWFHDKNIQEAEELVTKTTPLRTNNIRTKSHHYLDGDNRVAKLFADERNKSADNEIFYKALNQSLNAMIYYRNKGTIIKQSPDQDRHTLHRINYPVIVCNNFDNLYRVEIGKEIEPSLISENFQLEVNYAYMTSNANHINEYFLIDIINFDLIENYLEKIEADTNLVSSFI